MERTKEKLKIESKSGITLVALIVTIVILIILATISVNLVLNGGLADRTSSGKEIHELEREKERLEMVKGDVASNTNHIGKVTVDTYVKELINQGITEEEDITDNEDGSKTVITDTGYNVLIEPVGENDVKITINGKAGQLPPKIENVRTETVDETKLKITVKAKRADKYKYEYKKDDGNETSGWTVLLDNSSNTTATTPVLEEETSYMIKVTASNEKGVVSKIIKIPQVGEEQSIANAPKLSEGMTPVKWNGSNWEKTTESDSSWYNYTSSEKKWANVVLGDSTFRTVNGKEILDEDANYSMLVWIPRYAYRIKSMYHQKGEDSLYHKSDITAGKISIVFINTQNVNSVTGTKYTRDSAAQYPSATVGGAMSDYVVHPAFDFGSNKLPGFWVGKFESSFVGTGTTASSGRYNGTDKTMMIKANVSSWREITISNMFDVCLNMNKANNMHKLPTSDSTVDPHQMKNDEWGAVVYLSKSIYGAYEKIEEKAYINNNSNYITGISGMVKAGGGSYTTSTTNKYNTEEGQKVSTNGNITGIYDMSGGAEELTAAYVNNGHSYLQTYGASLVNNTNGRYKNVYTSTTTSGADTQEADYALSTPANGHYGDSIYETSVYSETDGYGSWYGGDVDFPYQDYPFFSRGNSYWQYTQVSLFGIKAREGYEDGYCGFRVVVPVL